MVKIDFVKFSGKGRDMRITIKLSLLLLHKILDKSGIRKEMIDEKDGMAYDFPYPSEVDSIRKFELMKKKDPDWMKKLTTLEECRKKRLGEVKTKEK